MMKTISSVELKQINRGKVYRLIYKEKQISKHEITKVLNMSLPTVNQYLSEMIESGMIRLAGFSESTGGRPATLYECDPMMKIGIGLEILADQINLVAVDIVGSVISQFAQQIVFMHSPEYYKYVAGQVDEFVTQLNCSKDIILGVTVSVQGLVSSDGKRVTYSKILGAEGITLNDFKQFMNYPCTLIHDTSAAAYAEIRGIGVVNDSIYISLNRFIGSALIINGELYKGRDLCGSTIEHMVLHQNGNICYCGKRGCVQTFCSGEALESLSQKSIIDFFEGLEQGDLKCKQIWNVYIQNTALMLNNARMVFDSDIIIGGEIASKISDGDLELLKVMVKDYSTFPLSDFNISRSLHGKEASVIGGALLRIDAFLSEYIDNL